MTTVPPPPPPTVAPPPKKSGCWKWGAIGCLAILLVLAVGVGVLTTIVFGAIKSTDAYKTARDRATHDPRVIEALGSPVEAGFWVIGNVHVDNNRGNASIEVPISGPKGKARVRAVASTDGDHWTYSELTVRAENGARIDLLQQ